MYSRSAIWALVWPWATRVTNSRSRAPARLPATYHRTHGIRCFHGCYALGNDQLWG
jgi:hypothetical protein